MKQLVELILNPAEDQKLVQYYLNYYQNRKEAVPLIAHLLTPNNKSLIELFLNNDHGGLNAQYLYDNNQVDFVDFIIAKHEHVHFSNIYAHFHMFVPQYAAISKLVTTEPNLLITQQVLDLKPIHNQFIVPLYYIQCCELLKSSNHQRFKETSLLIAKSKYYDGSYLLQVLFAYSKVSYNESISEFTLKLILDFLEKSNNLDKYNIFLLFCKSILNKKPSFTIQELIFKILFILFHFKCTFKTFKDFILLLPSLDNSVISTAYNTACEALLQCSLSPNDHELDEAVQLLFNHSHHLSRLLALKITIYASHLLLDYMVLASIDSHPVIKEYSDQFITNLQNDEILKSQCASQLPAILLITSNKYIPFVYKLIIFIDPSFLFSFINHCLRQNWYLEFDLLHDSVFTYLISSPPPPTSDTSPLLKAIQNPQYNHNKKHYFTLLLFLINPNLKVENLCHAMLTQSSTTYVLSDISSDCVLLFAACRLAVLDKINFSVGADLLQSIVTHDVLYIQYYVFLYLDGVAKTKSDFTPLLEIKNEQMKMDVIIKHVCEYYSGTCELILPSDNKPPYIVQNEPYLAFIGKLVDAPISINNLYFLLYTHVDINNMFPVFINHLKFLSTEHAVVFYNVFLKIVKYASLGDLKTFVSKVMNVDVQQSIYIQYFHHLGLLCQYSKDFKHLQEIHSKPHPLYLYFNKHSNKQVKALLSTVQTTTIAESLPFLFPLLYSFDSNLRILGLMNCGEIFKNTTLDALIKQDGQVVQNIPRLLDDPNPECQLFAISTLQQFIKFDLDVEQAMIFLKTLVLYGISNKDNKIRIASVGLILTFLKKFGEHDAFVPLILEMPLIIQQYSGLDGELLVNYMSSLSNKILLILVINDQNNIDSNIGMIINAIISMEIVEIRCFYYDLLIKCMGIGKLSIKEIQRLILHIKEDDYNGIMQLVELINKIDLGVFLTKTWARSTSLILDNFILSFNKQFGKQYAIGEYMVQFLSEDTLDYNKEWAEMIKNWLENATNDKQREIFEKLLKLKNVDLKSFIGLDVDMDLLKYVDKHNIRDTGLINDILMSATKSHLLKNWIMKNEGYVSEEVKLKFK